MTWKSTHLVTRKNDSLKSLDLNDMKPKNITSNFLEIRNHWLISIKEIAKNGANIGKNRRMEV